MNDNTYRVATPDGPAELAVITIETDVVLKPLELNRSPEIRGDRAIVASRVESRDDLFAVFELPRGNRGWSPVTEALTAAQLARWTHHRRSTSASMTNTFDAWLSRIRDQQAATDSKGQAGEGA